MTESPRPYRHQSAQFAFKLARACGAVLVAVTSYGALTTGAVGPDGGDVPAEPPVRQVASLSYNGTDLVITGSVDHLFKSGTFVGANRSEKRNRERISVDVASFSRSFDQQRAQLVALRVAPPEQRDLVSPTVAVASVEPSVLTSAAVAASPAKPSIKGIALPVAVASLGTPPGSSALSAIQSMAPDAGAPLPLVASQQLAYARANVPLSPASPQYQTGPQLMAADKQLWCMATAIYFEARGETYRGQVAVAQVVMNRTKHRLYPDTVCAVVFQNQHMRNACQFSFACDGHPESVTDKKSWAQAQEIAKKVIGNELYLTEVGNATHYHATYVKPHWAPRMVKLAKVGQHIFYRFKSGWSFG